VREVGPGGASFIPAATIAARKEKLMLVELDDAP
jgi:hypothetical protein